MTNPLSQCSALRKQCNAPIHMTGQVALLSALLCAVLRRQKGEKHPGPAKPRQGHEVCHVAIVVAVYEIYTCPAHNAAHACRRHSPGVLHSCTS